MGNYLFCERTIDEISNKDFYSITFYHRSSFLYTIPKPFYTINNLSKLKTISFTNFQYSEYLDRLLNSSSVTSYYNLLSLFKLQLNKNLENQIIPVFNQLLLYDSNNTEYVINSQDLVINIGKTNLSDRFFMDKDLLLHYRFVYINKERYIQKNSLLEMYIHENTSRIFIKKKEEMSKIIQEHLLKVIEEKTGVNFKGYNDKQNIR